MIETLSTKIEIAEYAERIKILRVTTHIPEPDTATVSVQVLAWQPSRYNGIPSLL